MTLTAAAPPVLARDGGGEGAGPRQGRSTVENAHALPVERVLAELHVDPAVGLNDSAVIERRQQSGANVLPHAKPRPLGRLLLEQFLNIIVLLLAVAAAIAWATGDTLEAFAILVSSSRSKRIGCTSTSRRRTAN